jgi:RHS repeat-associated protein
MAISPFTYDANGNLLLDGVNAYTWDRANRLLTFGGSSYEYNGLGQRVKQTVNSIATQYLLDMQPGLYKVLAVTTGSNTERYIHDPMGIAQHEDNIGNWHFLTKDGLDTVRHVYDHMLDEVYAVERDPYGELIADSGTNPTPFEYTGEPLDDNGLLHLRAPYYDSSLGVFVSLDPLETPNRYAYVNSDPINRIDPTGNTPVEIWAASFIEPAEIVFPYTPVFPPLPNYIGDTDARWEGNNRSWYTGVETSPPSSKSWWHLKFDTCNLPTEELNDSGIGETVVHFSVPSLSYPIGAHTFSGTHRDTADAPNKARIITENEHGIELIIVSIKGETPNPLQPFSPPIEVSYDITFNTTAGIIAIKRAIDAFP